MDRGVWRATVHGAAESQTRLKRPSTHTPCLIDYTLIRALSRDEPLEKGTATHSSGKSRGQRSRLGYGPCRRTESDMTEHLITAFFLRMNLLFLQGLYNFPVCLLHMYIYQMGVDIEDFLSN